MSRQGVGEQRKLQETALALVWVGEVWNLLEAGVAFWSGTAAGSVALLAFGLDSLIELFAGGVLIWRLRKVWGAEEAVVDRRAQRLVGLSFYFLAGYVALHSTAALLRLVPEPRPSLVGIVLVIVSAVVMGALYWKKTGLARALRSPALAAEAKHSLFCDLQDLPVVIGLGLNAWLGWWWADPVAALLLVPFAVREGWEQLSERCTC